MTNETSETLAERAKSLYERTLKHSLEASDANRYVAIEPESGRHFLGDTFLEAALAAKSALPDHKCFVLRIGHEAAFHIGAYSK